MINTAVRDEPLIADPAMRWLVNVAAWSGIALFFCGQDAISMLTRGQELQAWVFRSEVAYWWVWIPLTPVALWVARRHRITRANWRRSVAIHCAVALMIGMAHETILFALSSVLPEALSISPPGREVAATALRRFPVMVLTGFYKYWALIGVYYAFDYARKYRERDVAAAQLASKLAQAELQALRMQLQPHFLFNTLHAVSMLNFTDVDAANRMLVRLSDLLRMSLDNSGRPTVPLRVELEFLAKYLEIEQTRFQDRLTVSYDVDPELLDLEVPHLIMQPLVENAIRHGTAQLTRDGRIEVAASRTDHELLLSVCDNGPGLPRDWSVDRNAGIGITNTRARLRQSYGSAELLELMGRSEGGLCAQLRIPL